MQIERQLILLDQDTRAPCCIQYLSFLHFFGSGYLRKINEYATIIQTILLTMCEFDR